MPPCGVPCVTREQLAVVDVIPALSHFCKIALSMGNVGDQPIMADIVETDFELSALEFQLRIWLSLTATPKHCVPHPPAMVERFRPEPIEVWVGAVVFRNGLQSQGTDWSAAA